MISHSFLLSRQYPYGVFLYIIPQKVVSVNRSSAFFAKKRKKCQKPRPQRQQAQIRPTANAVGRKK